ncbi:MAG: conjugal transfer protein TraN [bacterium]
MLKKILIISLAIIALTSIKANAQYLCGSTGYIYRNQGFCNANCSLNGSASPCEALTSSTTSAPACPSGYEGFVFNPNNNTTYAVSTKPSSLNLSTGTATWTVTPSSDTGLPTNTVNAVVNNTSDCVESISGAQQISYNSNANQPNGQYTFQTTFNSNSAGTININLSVDDYASVYLNGQPIGTTNTGGQLTSCSDWNGDGINDNFTFTGSVQSGSNTLQVVVTNDDGQSAYENGGGSPNPMGVSVNVIITYSQQFWTYFNNPTSSGSMAVIPDSATNSLLSSILTYYNISDAWIGLYNPQLSTDYNTVNPDRPYSWVNGSSLSYTNWASGEPNNALPDQDLSLLPQSEYGQHWIEMENNGTWNDIGYNYTYPASQNYAPYLPALVQFNNQLSCVSGTQPPTPLTTGQQTNLANQYCGGNTANCYLCSNGTNLAKCQSGSIFPSGNGELCPMDQVSCNQKISASSSSATCPSGSSYQSSSLNLSTGTANWTVQNLNYNNGQPFNAPVVSSTTCITSVPSGSQVISAASGNIPNGEYIYQTTFNSAVSGTLTINIGVDDFADVYLNGTEIGSTDNNSGNSSCWNSSSTTTTDFTYTGSVIAGQNTLTIDAYNNDSDAAYNNGGGPPNPGAIAASVTVNNSYCVLYSCPLGNNNTCVNTGSGYYCSPYSCSNYNNSSSYTLNNPNINANNPTNNGTTSSAGECMGQIYIFSGQAMQCRDPGVQTGWGGGCCTADKKWFGLANCNSQEKLLAQQRAAGDCTMVGTYCAQSFLGYCLQTDQTWCCFPSLLANIIQQQTRAAQGLPISGWGTAQSPNCIGYTPQQFQAINFSKINLSAFYNSIMQQTSSEISGAATNAVNKFQSSMSGN